MQLESITKYVWTHGDLRTSQPIILDGGGLGFYSWVVKCGSGFLSYSNRDTCGGEVVKHSEHGVTARYV